VRAAMCGGCVVWELQCVGVAICRSRDVWNLQYAGFEECGSGQVQELQCMSHCTQKLWDVRVTDCGSCGVCE